MLLPSFFLSLVSVALAGQAVWFNTQCGTISVDRIDPIVSPGKPSNHLHVLFGAGNVDMSSTYASLSNASCNTCGVKEDQSAYWMPTVWFWRKDGTYSPLGESPSIPVYYKLNFAGDTIPKNYFQAFPKGFKMVTGNPFLRVSNRTSDMAERTLWYVCDGDRSVYYPGFPVGRSCKILTLGFNFPWCWNGQIDSPDHASHMSYPTNWETNNEMNCPSSHPLSLPVPFIEHDFDASMFANMYDQAMIPSQPFVLAMGDPTGFGIHTDFLNGWDFDRLSYVMQNYQPGDRPTDLGWLTSAHPACPQLAPTVPDNQGVPGQWVTELPGGLQASTNGVPDGYFTNNMTVTPISHGSYARLAGVDIGCGNIGLSNVKTVDACEAACDANSGCTGYTLSGQNCYLKAYTCGSSTNWGQSSNLVSGLKGTCSSNAATIGSAFASSCTDSNSTNGSSSTSLLTTSASSSSSSSIPTTMIVNSPTSASASASAAASPVPSHGLYARLAGIDIGCGQIDSLIVSSVDACEASCDAKAGCTAYTLAGKRCYWKKWSSHCSASQFRNATNIWSGLSKSCSANVGLLGSYASSCLNSDGSPSNVGKITKHKRKGHH